MRDYIVQVRYMEAGQPKSILHREYAANARAAAINIAKSLGESSVIVFTINQHDQFILFTKDVLNITVIAGE